MKKPLNLVALGVATLLGNILMLSISADAQQGVLRGRPDAPKSNQSLLVDSVEGGKIPLVQIQVPSLAAPPNDLPLQVTTNPAFHGTLAYAALLYAQPESKPYFVFRSTGVEGSYSKIDASIASYPVEAVGRVYNPRFSPDGTKMLFQVGWPFDRYGSYQLVLWDFERKTLNPVADALLYETVLWSPDSKYIAYVTGGDKGGHQSRGDEETSLNILEVSTGKSRTVFTNPDVSESGRWSWSKQSELLFTALPKEVIPTPPINQTDTKLKTRSYPSVYQVSAESGSARQIIKSACNPVASPDGKSVAFFGWAEKSEENEKQGESKNTEEAESKPALYVFNLQDKSRKLIFNRANGALGWMPNGKKILNLTTQSRSKQNSGTVATLDTFDVETLEKREVAQLEAADYRPVTRTLTSPQFTLGQVAQDGSSVLLKISEYTGKDHGFYTERMTINAINLRAGEISQLAQLENKWGSVVGWDWLSAPTQ